MINRSIFHALGCHSSLIILIGAAQLAFPASPEWKLASPGIPAARQAPLFVTDEARQKAVLFGGYSGTMLNDTWTFDGVNWTPANPSQSPVARQGAASAYDPDVGKIIMFGGAGGQTSGVSGFEILGDTWSWDGNDWVEISAGDPSGVTQPGLRSYPVMAYDPNHHQLILFGGWNGNYAQYLNDTWAFDGQSWTQLHPTNSPPGRSDAAMAYDPVLGQLVLFGGTSITTGVMGDMWTWTGSDWVQLNPDLLPSRRYDATLVTDWSNNTLLLFGGISSTGQTLAETWTWDGTNWHTQNPDRSPTVRSHAAATYLPSIQQVVLFSGVVTAFEFLQDTWTWDGAQWNQLTLPPLGRYDPSMTWDPATNAVVLFGGQSVTAPTGPGFINDTWTWNGTTWLQQHPVNSPIARNSAGLAYDQGLGKLVLFGGLGYVIFADTWLWDGADWTYLGTAHSPSPREDPAMVYDTALGKIVLFGGQGTYDTSRGTSFFGDTWAFDGSDWSQIQAEDSTGVGAPSRRSLAATAYDPVRQIVVLFGGHADIGGGTSVARGDMWTFNGTAWTQIGTDDLTGRSAPTPRYGARIEYDSSLGGLILFGGYDNSNAYLSDTWKWDGTAWTQLQAVTPPPGRELFGFAYDAIRQQIVLFGGGSSSNAFNSDTWTFGVPAVSLTAVVSRKTHDTAGTFDIDLPLTGTPGIECRTGGTNGDHQLVFTFTNALTNVDSVRVTSGIGSVSTNNVDPNDAHNYIVNLTGVTNAQTITVALGNVTDSAGNFSGEVSIRMGVLFGDVNGSGVVTSGDTNLCKAQALQPVTSANFRNDVNVSGQITTGDVNLIKQYALTQLP